ncbi:peptidyl-prolyl cis-trans isomerase [bacterium]|nr:peptidyl-prolyl cis-trans isomerase [bacterium]
MKERVLKKKVFFDGKTLYFTIFGLTMISFLAGSFFSEGRNPKKNTSASYEYLLSTASELEGKGVYNGAIDIYLEYLGAGVRISKNEKAGIYFRMAKIAGEKLADYDMAQKYSILVKNIVDPESSVFKENQRLLVTWLERGGKSVDAVNELKNTDLNKNIKKGGTIVAEVNGISVYKTEFDNAYEQIPQHMRKTIDKKVYFQQFIFRKLAVGAARREKLHKDVKVAQQLRQIEDDLVFKKYIESKTSDAKNISPDDASNYFKANPDKFKEPGYREAKIAELSSKDDKADWNKIKKVKVMQKSEYISGIGKIQGLVSGIYSITSGQTTEVFKDDKGKFYQARLENIQPERQKTFEEVKNMVFQMYYREKMEKEMKNLYEKLSTSGEVKVYEDRLK